MNRIGYYCWAGPGTIRMINLKFFRPKIDEHSLMTSYDYGYLSQVKEKFGITDFWATFSWGFSEETEKPDYEFLLARLDNFKKLGIKIHAYVQGPNVVYSEFPNVDWYCEDEKGRPITYFRGRRVVCLNNPGFVEYKKKQIQKMVKLGFDGIYMDNIQMGQMPVPVNSDELPYTFAGCNCKYCQKKFIELTGLEVPKDFEKDLKVTKKYLQFRVDTTNEFLQMISNIVHSANLEFGTNSFDPSFNTEQEFGTNLQKLNKIQDYLLFETLTMPSKQKNHYYIQQLCKNFSKPVFVISYKKGIGSDSEFSQDEIDKIYTEDRKCDFFACLKGSEYVTKGIWHNLYVHHYTSPNSHQDLEIKQERIRKSFLSKLPSIKLLRNFIKRYYNSLFTLYMENRFIRKIASSMF